ncbi:aminoacyl-tRNA hydrolase [candidate division LCP-89 bacterium B3_LCP]|uniref:Aminoacyl-tRNA hydrolase n=1 Tax=candidate division LCP-89 bacterium B3_LCP TaxID=2012998 RepID=A0A532UZK2_UNCL8|nr:MAG: aminoacyl-tRNA hydrolase [candidate division LCP-89 bacterium B3_LCP]
MSEEPPILLVAGLGNPGLRYSRTWHNMGYLTLDYWAESKGLTFKPGRGDYFQLSYQSPNGKVLFIKPTAYMNLSGVPVGRILRYQDYLPENSLIVCDDVALPLGTLRIRRSGSGGGQKGLSSIIAELGTEDVPRMRLGIFTEKWRGELSDYVLSRIPKALYDEVKKILAAGSEAIDIILEEGITSAMNKVNRRSTEDTNQQSTDNKR